MEADGQDILVIYKLLDKLEAVVDNNKALWGTFVHNDKEVFIVNL